MRSVIRVGEMLFVGIVGVEEVEKLVEKCRVSLYERWGSCLLSNLYFIFSSEWIELEVYDWVCLDSHVCKIIKQLNTKRA